MLAWHVVEMRIGTVVNTFGLLDPLAGTVAEIVRAEADGLASVWVTQSTGLDSLTALALSGSVTSRIELGVAVVPIQTRHPMALAQQARTVQLATGNRFTLGIGLSHRPFVEGVLGLPFVKPVGQLQRYLDVLVPGLAGEPPVTVPGVRSPSLLVAALGPQMVTVAARRTQGTVTWLTGPRTLRDHVVPTIRGAAVAAGAPSPRVVCVLPICVTDDTAGAFSKADERLAYTAQMPSYRAMMDREGIETPHELAIVGDEARVNAELDALAESGVDDFVAMELVFPGESGDRTRALLTARSR
jgi:5,10-methylenetetrahydromethanopterin reductase